MFCVCLRSWRGSQRVLSSAWTTADKWILYETDMVTVLDSALQYDYVREQGEAIGEAREKSAIARRMLEDGVPVETIAKYSGLTKEDVLKLAQP